MTNKNVLFIARTMGLGGTENVVLQLCEILLKKVDKIVVCSLGGVHEKKLREMGIKHYILPDIASKKPKDVYKIYWEIKNIIKKENITVIHSHHRMAAFYAEIIANKSVIKIATAHNTFYNKKKLTRYAYKNTRLIAVGDMVKKNLNEYFEIPNTQITVIRNAIKPYTGEFRNMDQLIQDKNNGYILVGNIGRLSEQKGLSYFIDAAELTYRKHSNARFYIVGNGELKEELIKKVEKKGLTKQIRFLGYRSDIQNIINQFDFLVLSSLWEGLPLTPIEAFSVGKTVIATSVDGTPEIINNGVNGLLVEAKNSEELSEKMNMLIENPGYKKMLEENAKKSFQNEFSFDRLEKEYIDFYRGV